MKTKKIQTTAASRTRAALKIKLPTLPSLHKPALECSLTKRLLVLCAVLCFGAFEAGVATANDLANANLDAIAISDQNNATPIGWSTVAIKAFSGAFPDGGSSEPWCNVADPDGYGFFFKPFQGQIGDEISVFLYQDNPATPGTKFSLSGYAAGEANYSGFFTTNNPPPRTLFVIEFLDASSTVLSSNAYDLIVAGLPSGGPGSMSLFTTPQYTAPTGTLTVRAGAAMNNTYSTSGGQSFFVDAFDLVSVAPPGSPVITNQPSSTTVALGANTSFTVGVSNTAGVSYQWQRNGINLSEGGSASGATSASLVITGASASDVAHYRCLVANSFGSVYSQNATLALLGLDINPVVTIGGKVGDTYRVDYSTAIAPTTWIPVSTNKLTVSPQSIIDSSTSGCSGNRFYRAVFLH